MEHLSDEPLIVLDGAHNDRTIRCLVEDLRKEFPQHTIHILSSALVTKDVDEIIQDLERVPSACLCLTSLDYSKTTAFIEMERYEDDLTEIVSLWQLGLGETLEKVSTDGLLLVAGLLYFVSQVKELLLTIGGNDEEI